jgi:hypothetical protein
MVAFSIQEGCERSCHTLGRPHLLLGPIKVFVHIRSWQFTLIVQSSEAVLFLSCTAFWNRLLTPRELSSQATPTHG